MEANFAHLHYGMFNNSNVGTHTFKKILSNFLNSFTGFETFFGSSS